MTARRPIRTPDIPELRAFCSAADLGTLGRAAVALRISQPALSKRLRSLEAIAGVSLLERSPSGVTLTDAGRRLYPEARRLLDQAEVVEGLLGGVAEERSPIRLAVSHTIAEFHLPPELVAHQADGMRHNPIELTVANSYAVRRMVADTRAEIGITARDANERVGDRLEELDLLDDEVIVAVPSSHPWHHRDSIPVRLLLSTPLVMRDPGAHDRRSVEAVLADRGLGSLSPLVEVGSTSVAKREALQRSAPVLLSRLALDEGRDRLVAKPVEGLRFPRRFVIVVRASGSLSRDEREFVAFLRRRRGPGEPHDEVA
ncbi:LysR family transcriptional regulator [Thermoleophilia bacterium SCSIO 60948]|nr:LysR family transcriptional regulator [Thermoleophilia bacterium SCSIO 60948]